MPTLRVARAADFEGVTELLKAASLPTDDLTPSLLGFVVAESQAAIVGAVALDGKGPERLLRSLVVSPEQRGTGLGVQLTERILSEARGAGVGRVVLLTTTAAGFFPRFGFREIDRTDVGEEMARHHEFTTACPSSATVMALELP